ncbi:mechanosensitive ion channel family protein [Puniceicoccus vermicola]|uniref:Mechanosensitive ion channel family protein n=1 Tax=Puniceicoccus vermicola TaxID=388746 RepID=A0A7X1E6H2_9BACT|nr:mechanosensitive ion channel family protein [Puniceicoccus vermicola]MBC2604249.1 mechanosensitive ion channel family protein [Puniceicoccus vermicola]
MLSSFYGFTLAAVAETASTTSHVTRFSFENSLRVFLILAIGIPVLYFLARLLGRVIEKRFGPHFGQIGRKCIFYGGILLLGSTILMQLGFKLGAVLGAAGILTVAIGFAAQTSLSNLISGIFILGEKAFEVGDLVRINGTLGSIDSIDLMSVKLRTPDNLYVRVPHEEIIKSQFTNITKFPIRRMDIVVGVAYRETLEDVIRVLKEIADHNPYSLDEPAPIVLVKDFMSSSIDLMLGMWFEKSNFLNLKNSVMHDIHERFKAEDIEIPFPHITVYSGSEMEAFPLEMRGKDRPEA